MSVKIGNKSPTHILFDKPITELEHKYVPYDNGLDLESWTLNSNQPAEGIIISGSTIIVTKFKPNEPIIISNHLSGKIAAVCEYSKNLKFTVTGLTANANIWGWYDNTVIPNTSTHGYIKGFGCFPYKTTAYANHGRPRDVWGEMPFACYIWDNITLSDGTTSQMGSNLILRGVGAGGDNAGYNRYNHYKDFIEGTCLPDWVSFYSDGSWYDTGFQLSIGLYTNANNSAVDKDGFITLEEPIYININHTVINRTNPTTVETFTAYLNGDKVYHKEKSLENVFGSIYNMMNIVGQPTSIGKIPYNVKNNIGLSYYQYYNIIDGTHGDTKWKELYSNINFPFPIDLKEKLQEMFPIKFCFINYDKDGNGFWHKLAEALEDVVITDDNWAAYLFFGSNSYDGDHRCNINVPISLTFDVYRTVLSNNAISENPSNKGKIITLMDNCFANCTSIPKITLRYKTWNNSINPGNDIHNAFKGCTSLKELTFIRDDGENWICGEISGAFEFCGNLKTWPKGLSLGNTRHSSNYSFDYCQLNYAFEYSGFTEIGRGESLLLYNDASQAFNYCGSLTTINLILDCKYLNPTNLYLAFNSQSIVSARIKTLNRGNIILDGTARSGATVVGNLPNLDKESIEYLISNLYDLSSNPIAEDNTNQKPTLQYLLTNWPSFQQFEWTEQTSGSEKYVAYCKLTDGAELNFDGTSYIVQVKLMKYIISNLGNGDTIEISDGNETFIINANGTYYHWFTRFAYTIKCNAPSGNIVRIDYVQTVHLEVSTVNSAILYIPTTWEGKFETDEWSDLIAAATAKGWTIQT